MIQTMILTTPTLQVCVTCCCCQIKIEHEVYVLFLKHHHQKEQPQTNQGLFTEEETYTNTM